MRWFALILLAAIGCGGGVTEQGMVDENGCHTSFADWSGPATLYGGCDGAPTSINVVNGTYNGMATPTPVEFGYDIAQMNCTATFVMQVSCGLSKYHMIETP